MKDLVYFLSLLMVLASTTVITAKNYNSLDNPIEISSIDQTQETCNLANGTLTINVDGDTTGMEYSIDAGTTFQSSNFFDNLESGDYLIIVRNATSCSLTRSIQIADAPEPEVDVTAECITGVNRSAVTPNVTGGIWPYSYEWTGNGVTSSDEVLSNVPPGEYFLLVTDNLGCTIRDTILIEKCCELETTCDLPPLLITCLEELPEIDTLMLNNLTTSEIKDSLSPLGILINDDPCGAINLTYTEIRDNNPTNCTDGPLHITRTYSVSDTYKSFDCTQNIEIKNTVAPTLVSPATDKVAPCYDDLQTVFSAWLDEQAGMLLNGCMEPYTYMTIPASPEAPLECGELVEVEFIIQDACGNEISSVARFSVVDNGIPDINCPPALTLDPSDPDMMMEVDNWIASASATDDCSAVSPITDLDRTLLDVTCSQSLDLPVIFETEDLCGNKNDCISNIQIDGLAAPTLECGEDTRIDCGSDRAAAVNAWMMDFVAQDGDGNALEVTNDLDVDALEELECNISTPVIFSIIDDCDRTMSCSREIVIVDEQDPIVVCPSPITFNASDLDLVSKAEDWLDQATATDNCSDVDLKNDLDPSKLVLDCDDSLILMVNFDAGDDCNNFSSCQSTIEIEGNITPELICGDDLDIACGDDAEMIIAVWQSSFTAEDGTGDPIDVQMDLDATTIANLSCGVPVTATFSIKDNCDNTLDCTRTITMNDTEEPEVLCPDALEMNDAEPDPLSLITPWLAEASAMDNCDPDASVTDDLGALPDLCDITSDIMVTFTSTDQCGNTHACSSSISVLHNLPSVTCPASLELECGDGEMEQKISEWMALAVAVQNDGNLVTNDFGGLNMAAGCNEVTMVTFYTNDDCGTETDCSSSFVIIDDVAPEISCPANIEIDLLDDNAQVQVDSWLADASATDCSSHDLDNDFGLNLSTMECGEVLPVLFTAVDVCGLISTCTSDLTFVNSGDIDLICPEPIEFKCSDPQLDYKIATLIEEIEVTADNTYVLEDNFDSAVLQTGECLEEGLTIEVVGVDACGRENVCQIQISFIPEPQIYIPNVISPDNDGFNDYFTAFGNESVDYISSMTIFNRWGNKIFEVTDISINEETQGWDGRYGVKDEGINVYTYHIQIIDTFGQTIDKAGTVQILK